MEYGFASTGEICLISFGLVSELPECSYFRPLTATGDWRIVSQTADRKLASKAAWTIREDQPSNIECL